MSDQTATRNHSNANVNQAPSGENDDLESIFGKAEDPMAADVWDLEADLEASFSQADEPKKEKPAAKEKTAKAVEPNAQKVIAVENVATAAENKVVDASAAAVEPATVAAPAAVAEEPVAVDPKSTMAASEQTETIVENIEPKGQEEKTEEDTIHGWEKIKEIAQQVVEQKHEVKESVRTLIGWFGARRRGSYVIGCIQRELEKGKIKTEPDFADAYIDTVVRFVPVDQASAISADEFHDPTFRISQLSSADMTLTESSIKEATMLVSISPDASVKEAVTLMMMHDFSQLPVMTSPREVKGVISWESIGKHAALSNNCKQVKDCMVKTVPEVRSDSSMFSAIELIVRHGFVLVRQQNKVVSGIVTTTDLSLQFRQLAEPFLLVGEIENYIRFLIEYKFSLAQLQTARDPRDARSMKGVADLSFGEYVRLLENPENWEILDIPVDRTIFVKRLDRIRELRNEIMHFDPDPFDPQDLETLRLFANFIRTIYINKKAQ
ncbi:MAG: CBS domain-containing protein [Cyanobacteria bacterium J06573_11]